jgi:hypothetical protein
MLGMVSGQYESANCIQLTSGVARHESVVDSVSARGLNSEYISDSVEMRSECWVWSVDNMKAQIVINSHLGAGLGSRS